MPSGRTHDRITWGCAPVVLAGSLALWQRADVTLAASVAFVVAGTMFGPDLDIHSIQVKRWGPLRGIWRPYQRAMKHRSFWSHGFGVGTVVRLLYLLVWLLALALALGVIATGLEWVAGRSSPVLVRDGLARAIAAVRWLWWERQAWIWAVLIGLELGAASHYVSDFLESMIKRSRVSQPERSKRPGRSPQRPPRANGTTRPQPRKPTGRKPRRTTRATARKAPYR